MQLNNRLRTFTSRHPPHSRASSNSSRSTCQCPSSRSLHESTNAMLGMEVPSCPPTATCPRPAPSDRRQKIQVAATVHPRHRHLKALSTIPSSLLQATWSHTLQALLSPMTKRSTLRQATRPGPIRAINISRPRTSRRSRRMLYSPGTNHALRSSVIAKPQIMTWLGLKHWSPSPPVKAAAQLSTGLEPSLALEHNLHATSKPIDTNDLSGCFPRMILNTNTHILIHTATLATISFVRMTSRHWTTVWHLLLYFMEWTNPETLTRTNEYSYLARRTWCGICRFDTYDLPYHNAGARRLRMTNSHVTNKIPHRTREDDMVPLRAHLHSV